MYAEDRQLDDIELTRREADIRDRMADLVELNETLQRENDQLREQAFTDHLTQVFNRSGFTLLMDEKWLELERLRHDNPDSARFSLLCIDFDDFKSINDTFGHTAGDKALKAVADTITTRLREGDLVSRFGGDEFVIGLLNADQDSGVAIANELIDLVAEQHIDTPDGSFNCSISIGVTSLGSQKSWSELYDEADQALVQMKQQEKGRVAVHS